MRCITPEISWHNRDPVLSVDIQRGSYKTSTNEIFWRVATGGADSHVLIWHLLSTDNGGTTIKCVADLERHQKTVNIVRFSPSKEVLASGDDESAIILWKQKEECEYFTISSEKENKEQWSLWKVLRGHIQDIYDISWSMDSNSLISGSVDNTAILWDIKKGRNTGILSDSKGFVQGVAWDPCNKYVCTISTDRQCRLIDINTKKTIQRVHKSKIPTPSGHPLQGKSVTLFYDDTFKSFFRRLTFSLDGLLIVVPSGIIEPEETTGKISNATIIFSRYNLKEPIMVLPSLDECTIAVRFCPIYFELKENGPTPAIVLPYRMIFAVATHRSVIIYDTQQTSPIAVITNIHYTRLTDIAWSSDGFVLLVSSTDGYCSIIHFQKDELGQEYTMKNKNSVVHSSNNDNRDSTSYKEVGDNTYLSFNVEQNAVDADIIKHKLTNVAFDQVKISKPEKLETLETRELSLKSGDIQKQDNSHDKVVENTENVKAFPKEQCDNIIPEKNTSTNVLQKPNAPSIISNRAPRRVQLITISNPKERKKT